MVLIVQLKMEGIKMEELAIRDYPIGLLENLIGTNGKQATEEPFCYMFEQSVIKSYRRRTELSFLGSVALRFL